MPDPKVLKRVRLTSKHKPTGNTRHYHGTHPVPAPAVLRIVQYESDSGFYLFYCDESGTAMIDTYHESIEAAMDQAEFEFRVEESDWEDTEAGAGDGT